MGKRFKIREMEKRCYDRRLASHSFRRGHLFLDRFPSQSPQMVMSWLQGVKTSDPSLFIVLGTGALRVLPMLLTFVIKHDIRHSSRSRGQD